MTSTSTRFSVASASDTSDVSDLKIPTTKEVRAAIPSECFEQSTFTSFAYCLFSVSATLAVTWFAWLFIPLSWAWLPVWMAYAVVCGTVAMGGWVIAHECGHGAFSKSKRLSNVVGFVLHSLLLVPYFSWQRSHAVHHAKTNHVTEGETHVPKKSDTERGRRALRLRSKLGAKAFGVVTIASRLGIGWPLYLVSGITGSPVRGATNHFWPWAPFSSSLFPKRLASKVFWSSIGVVTTLVLLVLWAFAAGSLAPVLAFYVGPYLVVNAWLVTYTWLQHTNEDVPHYDTDEWSFVKGAFCSVDRPYGRVINFLHHNIGSTHVVHHLNSSIPHYHADTATKAVREAFPALYRFDSTPVIVALWRAGASCVAVTKSNDGWSYVSSDVSEARP